MEDPGVPLGVIVARRELKFFFFNGSKQSPTSSQYQLWQCVSSWKGILELRRAACSLDQLCDDDARRHSLNLHFSKSGHIHL
jgi:hypothetical protein